MRKGFLVLAALSTLTLSHLNAQTLRDIYFSGGSVKIGTTSETAYELGYGVNSYYESGFMWGAQLNGGMIDAKRNGYYYGGDFKLGFTPFKNSSLYGLGAVIWQDFDGGLSGGGFGYGGGVEYRLAPWLAIAGEYKTYSMTYDRVEVDEDYSSTLMKVIFTF